MKTVTIPRSAKRQRSLDAEADALLQQILNANPQQLASYMNTHVQSLAQAREILVALAIAVRFLYLRERGD